MLPNFLFFSFFVVLTLVQYACIFFFVQILQFGFWTNMLSNILNVSTHSCVIQLLIEQFHVNGTIIKPSASKLHCNLAFGTCCEIIIRCFKMLLQQNIHAIWIFINSRITFSNMDNWTLSWERKRYFWWLKSKSQLKKTEDTNSTLCCMKQGNPLRSRQWAQ